MPPMSPPSLGAPPAAELPWLRVPRVPGASAAGPPGAADAAGVSARGLSGAALAAFPWERAALAGPLVLADGSAAAAQATWVRVAWDEAALWVRFDCADRDAWGTYERRNDPIYQEEAVEVFLAPGTADPHDYWELEVSPRGVMFAAHVHNPTWRRADLIADTAWPARGVAWTAAPARPGAPVGCAVRADDVGSALGAPGADGTLAAPGADGALAAQDWWAALAIPWTALAATGAAAEHRAARRGAPPPRLWRANFYRIERPRDGPAELSCWSPTLTAPPDFHQPPRFGTLELAET